MRVSLEQIRLQNEADRMQFHDLTVEIQNLLTAQVQILRTSRYRDNLNPDLVVRERIPA